jgi:3-hydroxy-D-aspartate aldolase
MHRDEIPTPALLLDLPAFESNVARMTAHVAAQGKALRPHGKTHKCPEIAKRLIAAGAVGACTAKLGEAEVFAAHGVRGLLVTTAIIGKAKAARAATLARLAPDTIVVADDVEAVRVLGDAAWRAGVTLRVAVDLYFGRTGVPPGAPAREVARAIDRTPSLVFAGLQAYDGTASHTAPLPPNGALIITTVRNTSGRVSAHQPATGEPKSWPTTPASERWPSAAVSASMSRTRLSVENGARSSSKATSVPPLRP